MAPGKPLKVKLLERRPYGPEHHETVWRTPTGRRARVLIRNTQLTDEALERIRTTLTKAHRRR